MSRKRLLIGCLACSASLFANAQGTEQLEVADAATGVRVAVDERHDLPALRIHVAGQAESDPGIFVLFPEHVTARERDQAEPRQLYLFRPGRRSGRPAWRRDGRSLEYRLDIAPGVMMLARATLEADGIRYTYRFENRSATAYAKMQAVTDPRMESPTFRDVRLERSYVHHRDGFDLARLGDARAYDNDVGPVAAQPTPCALHLASRPRARGPAERRRHLVQQVTSRR